MDSSLAAYQRNSTSSSTEQAPQMFSAFAESDANELGQVIEKRIRKIYKRLKETDSNLKAMEKLMIGRYPRESKSGRSSSTVDGDYNDHRRRPVSYQRLTQSMQDLYETNINPLPNVIQPSSSSQLIRDQPEEPSPNMIDRDINLQLKLSNLESQQSKLQNTLEMLNRNLETSVQAAKSPMPDMAGDQLRMSISGIENQLKQATSDLEQMRTASNVREKELKTKAKKTISSWKIKCESLLVDKKFLEDHLLKSREQNQMLIKEQQILHLQLDEIHQRLKNEVHENDEFKLQIVKNREDSAKKDEISQKYQSLYSDSRMENALQKIEIEKLEKKILLINSEKLDLERANATLQQRLRQEENNKQKSQTYSTSERDYIKRLENENEIFKRTVSDLQKNIGKSALETDSLVKSLEMQLIDLKEENKVGLLKSEKLNGEIECLKSELQELKLKHDRVLKDYYTKSEECISKAKRITRLEESLKDNCKTLNYKDQDFKVMLACVNLEMDKILNSWNSISGNVLPIEGFLTPNNPSCSHLKVHWLDIQSKLKLLQDELSSWSNVRVWSKSSVLPNSENCSKVDDERKKQNVFEISTPVSHFKINDDKIFNIERQKRKKKVNSTKMPTRGEVPSINENISSHKFLHNSSLSISSISKSADSSEDPSTS